MIQTLIIDNPTFLNVKLSELQKSGNKIKEIKYIGNSSKGLPRFLIVFEINGDNYGKAI